MENFLIVLLELVFWGSLLGLGHTYLIYPWIMARWKPRRPGLTDSGLPVSPGSDADLPSLYVVMAVYNEEAVLGKTLESILGSDYPKDKLTILIGSDHSTDRSHEIIQDWQRKHGHLRLEIFGARNGKIRIINSLVHQIPRGEDHVLLLCDANVVWSRNLARNLARHFSDPTVGIVASCVIDSQPGQAGISAQEQTYIDHENRVKHHEGLRWGRMMGAFGACYAMRRDLFEAVPAHFNVDDFYETMICYEKGYKGIVDLEAICHETVSQDIREEFRRKKRIAKGNFQNLRRFSGFLLPWNCGLPTWFAFWSHKGLRWTGPLLLFLIVFSGAILMCKASPFYYYAMAAMAASFVLAGIDKAADLLGRNVRLKFCRFIRYFYAMNLALFLGGLEFLRGVRSSVWEPTRRVTN